MFNYTQSNLHIYIAVNMKVKVPLHTSWKHSRGVKVQLCTFLTSAVDGCALSTLSFYSWSLLSYHMKNRLALWM